MGDSESIIVLASFGGLVGAGALVPICARLAHRLNILDIPDGYLKRHTRAVPYLGGIAVHGAFTFSLILLVCSRTLSLSQNLCTLWYYATALLLLGLIDDLYVLKPYQKFLGQVIATVSFLMSQTGIAQSGIVLLVLFWMVSLINAYNLVDVMDGLATALAACNAFYLLIGALLFNNVPLAIVLAAFIGALMGFLWFNYPPACIHLGDAGSLYIGGLLAGISISIPWATYTSYGYAAPSYIALIPFLEVGTLVLIRFYKDIPFYYGSPDHFSIYLQQNGWSKSSIVLYTIGATAILGLYALLLAIKSITFAYSVVHLLFFILLWYGLLGGVAVCKDKKA